MSGADLDRIKANIKEKAAAELNARGEKAADAIMGKTSGSAGIQFEDVEGVGDEARFALTVGAGDLHVRVGNLYFTTRSEEHTSELQSLMRISYAVFCLKKKTNKQQKNTNQQIR